MVKLPLLHKRLLATFIICGSLLTGTAQPKSDEAIRTMVESYKTDPKGPYQDIRWYCPDGTVIAATERCNDPGGVQHARLKSAAAALASSNGIYLGQILTGTAMVEFWNESTRHSRMKQYQLEQYLKSIDNGWIQRRAQYYRGAFQVEDEENWGRDFYLWLLAQNEPVIQHFYLVRESLRDIPHQGDDHRAQAIRSQSKTLSEDYPAFMDLRVKIHSQPDEGDVQRVRDFTEKHLQKLSASLLKRFDELIANMEQFYKPIELTSLLSYTERLPETHELRKAIAQYVSRFETAAPTLERLTITASFMWRIRREIIQNESAEIRLDLLELSLKLEDILLRNARSLPADNLRQQAKKIQALSLASAASGSIEMWEWEAVSERVKPFQTESATLAQLMDFQQAARSVVEWGVGMCKAEYEEVVELYRGFEPLASGFIDDRIRSSIGLLLGEEIARFSAAVSRESGMQQRVLDLKDQGSIRGMNAGVAFGELVIVDDASTIEFDPEKIYICQRPPSDMKPVAGIATVSEGNLVSHVQLLARNLGIPNAVISDQNLEDLRAYAGQRIFYAVSSRGTVLMKTEEQMSASERELFVQKKRSEERIRIEAHVIRLDQLKVLNLRELSAEDSGKSCGPKAANLAQLKAIFPNQVVEGIVIPFGIFKAHMDQPMPGKNESYWEFLLNTFHTGNQMRGYGVSESEVEAYLMRQLAVLRSAITEMPLLPSFLIDLQQSFESVLGGRMGEIPVFLRSDTNMEDLKEFTGAGLNLTLFNVLQREKIIQGIKDVWASPYSERSYKWRQRYLLNPENVFPSILIIPSVDVEKSGVMITKGVSSGIATDLTIAFSRGAGGAVDGQAAESYSVSTQSATLLAPSREAHYNRLPGSGGTQPLVTTFDERILSPDELNALRQMGDEIKKILPTVPAISSTGPYDVELGLKDGKIWLFQVRPFVENKHAQNISYLDAMQGSVDPAKSISLMTKL